MPRRGRKTETKSESSSKATAAAYEVDMTETAAAVYEKMFRLSREAEKNGDYTNQHCTTFRMVKEAIKEIIPKDPLNKKYALRGELANLFRLRKGRIRISWIASSKVRRVLIIFISETLRKDGDANDPYVILQSLMDSGRFDEIFQHLGVHRIVTLILQPSLQQR